MTDDQTTATVPGGANGDLGPDTLLRVDNLVKHFRASSAGDRSAPFRPFPGCPSR